MAENALATQTPHRQQLTISLTGLARATAILDDDHEIDSRTALLPSAVAQAVVDAIDAEPPKAAREAASEFVALLLRCYPDWKAHDAKGYAVALHALFAAHPASIGRRVVDPLKGLPTTLKFTPKVADVATALKAEMKRRELIRANALSHIIERERRAEAARVESEYWAARPAIEERRRQVERLLGGDRLKRIIGEARP